ncbi:MAG: acyl carrier protein [Gemmataceae bacterium]|nr:acyl carrier protein [Gemmataceae bacterium]
MSTPARTPEATLNRCPLCHADATIEAAPRHGDAPCPRCSGQVWYARDSGGARLYDAATVASIKTRIAQILKDNLGANPETITYTTSFVEDIGADSLDIVQLVMALEESFGVTIPDEQAEKIRTVGDAIDYILTHKA